MSKPRRGKRIFCWAIIALCCLLQAEGYCDDDGFGWGQKLKGKHFTVTFAQPVDPVSLAMSLDLSPADYLKGETSGDLLADMLDVLFIRVCDILDMRVYSYEGNIKVCRDAQQLNSIYEGMFRRTLTAPSFYSSGLDTIYIDAGQFSQWILGHEIAHAVMCHYFVVQPPEKVAEVLAQYVEYQLRKK